MPKSKPERKVPSGRHVARQGTPSPKRRITKAEAAEIFRRFLDRVPPPSIQGRNPQVPPALAHVVEMALALANEPRLLLLDEPVCGMGPEETERTVMQIKELSKSIDVLLIEHDMEVVFAIADRIVVMAQGGVLASGQPAEIAANKDVQEAYLGSPEDEL